MDETPVDILTTLANLAVLAVIVGGVYVWLTIFRRVLQRRPVIPFEPRRPVPWNGFDVLAVLFGYVCLQTFIVLTANLVLGWEFNAFSDHAQHVQQAETLEGGTPAPESQDDPQIDEPDDSDDSDDGIDLDQAHPVVVLLSGDRSLGTLILCLFAVVVMAPLAEEFFFRLLLQGYFEKVDLRLQRRWRFSGLLLGLMPILLSSLLFASLHAREPEAPVPVEQLIRLFAIDSFTKVLLVAGAILYLKTLRGATWADLGIRFDTFWQDLRLAFATFLAVVVPIYILQEGLSRLLPNMVPDPVPLFFFALALGYLYFRTHRLMPAILLHLIFNATAICMFFAVM